MVRKILGVINIAFGLYSIIPPLSASFVPSKIEGLYVSLGKNYNPAPAYLFSAVVIAVSLYGSFIGLKVFLKHNEKYTTKRELLNLAMLIANVAIYSGITVATIVYPIYTVTEP